MKSPKLVRMTPAPLTTEYNDRNGLFTAHDDGKFYLPPDSVPDAIKVGFRPAPLSQSVKLANIMDLIADLDESPAKATLWEAHRQTQVAIWKAIQARQAAASQSSSAASSAA
jgi:hypothetical protein